MYRIFKNIILVIILILSIFCYKVISDMNIIPNKYLFMFLMVLIILNIIGIIFMFLHNKIFNIISNIIYILLFIISIIGIWYSSSTIKYLNKSFNNNNKEILKYNVIVLNNSGYDDIYSLENKTIGYISIEFDNYEYLDVIDNMISIIKVGYNFNILYNSFMDGSIDAIVIEDNYIDMVEEEYNNFISSIKIIYSYEVEVNNSKSKTSVLDNYVLSSFNVYISGSDSRSNSVIANSRSDVNMIVSVNPNTNKILLTSIPRDYYVQLHGTSGIKDKLTHAGIYGVDMCRETLEDLFGIKIDYSIKVSMSSIVSLVDLVGGIDIDSDIAFNSYHIKGWTVNQGINHMNGVQALAYARERYAYSNGDVHRIQNQQQVLTALINKIFCDKSILLKYDSFLDSFSDLYTTDIPKDLITSFVKKQLNEMNDFDIEKQYVVGTGSMCETFSMMGIQLYVMIPDMSSVKNASDNINSIID